MSAPIEEFTDEPAPGGPVYNLYEVTPAVAADWLAKWNDHNRPMREHVAVGYAADMKAGKWREDGQPIQRACTGVFINGQHRLRAVVLSGETIRFLVVSNLPLETQDNIDTHTKRTFGDVLKLKGEKYYVPMATISRRVYLWKLGIYRNNGTNTTVTNRQLLAVLAEHPEIRDSAQAAHLARAGKAGVSTGTFGVLHWVFNRIDPDDCAVFFEQLTYGANIDVTDPVYVLRKTLAKPRDKKSATRMPDDMVTALVIKAWNAYRDGRKVQILQYRPGGANPEKFPTPK